MTRAERRRRTNRIANRRVAECLHNGCNPASQPPEWSYVFEPGYWRKRRMPKNAVGQYGRGYAHQRTAKRERERYWFQSREDE